MRKLLILTLVVLVVAACDSGHPPTYHGALYFGQDAYVMRYSLQDGSRSVEGHLGDTTIRDISALGSGHLLITESALVNRRRVSRISWFDTETGESAYLYPGVLARYLAASDLIVYDDGSSLYAVPQRDGSANEVIWEHPQNWLSRLVEAAPDLLLIEAGAAGQTAIHSWKARTGQLRQLDGLTAACRLEGAVWIEPMQLLACKPPTVAMADALYVLADLDGRTQSELRLPANKQFFALTYISGQHVLLLQETRPGLLGSRDKHTVWLHDIDTGASIELPGSVNLGKSVVYAEF